MTGAVPSRVVVLGAQGMFGHVAATVLHESGHLVTSVSRAGTLGPDPQACDVTDRERLQSILEHARPDWVINAVGSLNAAVDAHPAAAIYVNSVLPHLLAEWGPDLGYRVFHVSTDCVFSGDRGGYLVSDPPDARSLYGLSKALGEIRNDRDLTVRTSIIGPELSRRGVGLLKWFMESGATVEGWTSARWTGLTTLELARVAKAVVEGAVNASGLWQCVPGTAVSKYELVQLLSFAFRSGEVEVIPVPGHRSDKSLVNDRPALWTVPDYARMLAELREWVEAHRSLYDGTSFGDRPAVRPQDGMRSGSTLGGTR